MRSNVQRDIVVFATREASSERDQHLMKALSLNPDWEAAIQLAEEQGVAPLLASVLEADPFKGAVPKDARRWLSAIGLGSAVSSGRLLNALEVALRAFDSQAIDAVVLKGAALATTLYPNVALRPSKDLDLLCRGEQLDAATDVLRSLGYEQYVQKPTEQDGFHLVFHSPAGVEIELHTDLLQLGLPARCSSHLWQHLTEFSVRGTPASMLSPEYQMLHLSVHLHTHGYWRLIWFKDLDLLLRHAGKTLNWERIHELVVGEGATLSLRHSLTLVHALLGTPLPAAALSGLHPDALGSAAHMLIWPQRRVIALQSKQRLRSLRFNPRLGPMGVLPNMVVMGRRKEKIAALLHSARQRRGKRTSAPGAPGAS